MGDNDGAHRSTHDEPYSSPPSASNTHSAEARPPFHSQFEYISNPQAHLQQEPGQYGQQPFDMGAMAGALPHSPQHHMHVHGQVGGMMPPHANFQQIPQTAPPFQPGRNVHMDPASLAHQQQYIASHYAQQQSMGQRPAMSIQTQGQFGSLDPYGYGMSPVALQQMDPRFAPQGSFAMSPSMAPDMSQYLRRVSEPAPIPSFPRGPPRKPKQSGHALWVGNLPPSANVSDLKDHFSREATKDIESLFLISKSNCAFVNYRTEAACIAAMNRFHDSRFNGVRLVCRLRRGTGSGATASLSAETVSSPITPESPTETPSSTATPVVSEEPSSPVLVNSQSTEAASSTSASQRPPEKYFIVKSLTTQDLEASVRNGVWATQSHNETALNDAYERAEKVYLVFSANKSGEYFGYARMASKISGEPVNLGSSSLPDEPFSPGTPQSISTPATATAPKGRIIDDSARGTIFWEAENSESEGDESPAKYVAENQGGQNWGRQFSIEWISTTRLPFYRTRGLRNSWNSNREVKIARDGTELETSVGRRLVQMFHRPLPNPNPPQPVLSPR